MVKLPAAPAAPIVPVALPTVTGVTGPMLTALTDALGVDRTVLASDDQIAHAWNNLPRLLGRIPPELRSETLMRMCVAVATGLFDSAINYAWNASVMELRNKVRAFGINVVPQIIGKPFDEKTLLDQKDVELLTLCLKLNLISEDGYFLLDQCRDIRNNFSAAHPTVGTLDEDEFLAFLNRCARHALANERNPRAVDIQNFIVALKAGRLSTDQIGAWNARITDTYEAQRDTIFTMLYGLYCDPTSGEETRVNAITICSNFVSQFTPKTRSELVDRHQEYIVKGDNPRHVASQQFFERLGILGLLGEAELHAVITGAVNNLYNVHNGIDNFYNEPPFADRLSGLVTGTQVPESAQYQFVTTVLLCAVGNRYGTSNAAEPFYQKMVKSFSPNEIKIMLELPSAKNSLSDRLNNYARCRNKYVELVKMLAQTSVPTNVQSLYDFYMKQ